MRHPSIAVKHHAWVKMTMQDVAVVGHDPQTEEPFGVATGEERVGINCGACGAPYPEPGMDEGVCLA